jgi:CRISPR-associated endonuclease/helicase Cas3
MGLYPYQERIDELLRAGRSVILQAPTGAGKTRAALFPFLDGWRNDPSVFPRQCVYAVPMRVLANQFEAEYRAVVSDYANRFGLLNRVSIQTGARPEDRRLEADLIFTTIDQALSSFLTIPYSLGNRQVNLNAGALIGSYLVFDEFHLFPVDESANGALATSLQILQLLKGITPFVLMTATFSQTMIERLATLLDAEPVTLKPEEVSALPSQQGKHRSYRFCAVPMSAEAIITDLQAHHRRRVIAICNTVERAQNLARKLRADLRLAGVQIELLHGRFYSSDRKSKEERIRKEFGEGCAAQADKPMILVATQVIEVGLNITCDALHTDLAPAAAIIQRAGRCARFANEAGDVYVYELPLNDKGELDYAPYFEEEQRPICERTRDALKTRLSQEGQILSYHDELSLVDDAHSAYDEQLLATLQERQYALSQRVVQALSTHQRNLAPELIRDVDTRTILIHPNPTEMTLPNPYRLEGIGLRPGQLVRWYEAVRQHAWHLGLDWIARIGQPQEAEDTAEGAEQRHKIITTWQALPPSTQDVDIRAHKSDLWSSGYIVALNPALVQYSEALGLELMPDAVPTSASPMAEKKSGREEYGPIHHESYAQHIAGLYRVYVRDHRERTMAVRRRLEQRFGLDEGALDRAIRLMFAVHDLGKLDQMWQAWAHRWQARVAELRQQPELVFPPDYVAAHTDYDSQDERERKAQGSIRPPRPNHAAESARAGRDLLAAVSGGNDSLYVALMSAIICHHSAHLRTDHGPFKPATGAKPAFYEAMREVGLFDDEGLRASGARIEWKGFAQAEGLSDDIISVSRNADVVLYLFLVRILRLCDQGSQEPSR